MAGAQHTYSPFHKITICSVQVGEKIDGFFHMMVAVRNYSYDTSRNQAEYTVEFFTRLDADATHGIDVKGERFSCTDRFVRSKHGSLIPHARTLASAWGRCFEREIAFYIKKNKLLLEKEAV